MKYKLIDLTVNILFNTAVLLNQWGKELHRINLTSQIKPKEL